jgi:hypothetical protein
MLIAARRASFGLGCWLLLRDSGLSLHRRWVMKVTRSFMIAAINLK